MSDLDFDGFIEKLRREASLSMSRLLVPGAWAIPIVREAQKPMPPQKSRPVARRKRRRR